MSTAASTSKATETTQVTNDKKNTTIGVLEEDDEFEEFPVADWNDDETDLAHIGVTAPGAANSGGDKLWEDNWDDDDIEDEFSTQLRNELAKTKASEDSSMQH